MWIVKLSPSGNNFYYPHKNRRLIFYYHSSAQKLNNQSAVRHFWRDEIEKM